MSAPLQSPTNLECDFYQASWHIAQQERLLTHVFLTFQVGLFRLIRDYQFKNESKDRKRHLSSSVAHIYHAVRI